MRRRSPGVERDPGARVGRRVVLTAAPNGRIVLGPGAVVGPRCRLHAAAGATVVVHGVLEEGCRLDAQDSITIEHRAHLGAGCALIDHDPVTTDVERPVREQGTRALPIRIAARAFLGPRVVVLGGVTVGAGATVGAHSVCRRDVPAGATVAGTPAHRPKSSTAGAL